MAAMGACVRTNGRIIRGWWVAAGVAVTLACAAMAAAQVPVDLLAPPTQSPVLSVPLVEDAVGNLYGMTSGPPATIFRMTSQGSVATVHVFTDVEGDPISLIHASDGN